MDMQKLCLGCLREKPDFTPECPHCKFDETQANMAKALPLRCELESRYVIGKEISSNGESITYNGFDKEQNTAVRITEYFPATHCERINLFVKYFSESEYIFETYKQSFLELARSLARMRGLSAILPVYDIFEANGTAYYVCENVESITLRDFLIRNGGSLTFDQARPLFMPILSTLSSLHAVGIYHRGISPETMIIGKDGKLRLVDFTTPSARLAHKEIPSQLFKGYAAIEQYDKEGVTGPYTDVYSLAAVLYRTLVGSPPPEAVSRVTNDKMIIPANIAETLSAYVLSALANALQVLPKERTKTIENFRDELSCAPNVLNRNLEKTEELSKAQIARSTKTKSKSGTKFGLVSAAVTLVVLAGILFAVYSFFKPKDDAIDANATTTLATQTTANYSDLTVNPNEMEIPEFKGMTYAQMLASKDPTILNAVNNLEFVVVSKKFSNEPKGTILSQEPKVGKKILKGETIKLVISLGEEKFAMPSLLGLEKDEAYIKLLEAGFLKDNIKFSEKYDATAESQTVIDVTPKAGDTVNSDIFVTVYINSFVPTTTTQATTTDPFGDNYNPYSEGY